MGDTDDGEASQTGKSEHPDAADISDKFDYEIAKWIANSALKRNKKAVDEEMARHERLETLSKTSALGAISDYVLGGQTQRENQSLLIDEYWSSVSIEVKYKGLSKQQIRGLLVLQNAFRTWIILKRYRDTLKTKASDAARSFGDVKGVATSLYIQSSARRVIAKMTVETKIDENKKRDQKFAKFCGMMKEGITVTMFSRKYGTAPSRKISFDKDLNNLTFSTSFGTRGKIALKSIYKIHKGISETMYPHSRQAQLSRCICLECLGERVVDMELTNAQQAREMYVGFERLILLLSGTKSPFYIDNFGIPRRAGPSIIENAINEATIDDDYSNRIYKSKPDEMRFWGAVRLLQQEYDTWQQEQDAERREHIKKKEEEAEKIANKLNEREKAMAEGRGGRKVTKLVRFVDADGENQLVEQVDKKNMRGPPDEGLIVTLEKAEKGKKKKIKEYDIDTSGKGKKWKFNPFKKKGKKAGSEKSTNEKDTSDTDTSGFDFDPFTKKEKKGVSEKSNSVRSVKDYGGKHNSEIDFNKLEEKLNQEKQRGLAQDALGAMSSDDINEYMRRSRSSDQTASEHSRSRKFSEVLSQTSFDGMLGPDATHAATNSTGGSVRLSDDSADPKAYSVSLKRSTRSMSDVSSISKSSAVVPSFWSVLFCQAPMQSYESDDDYSVVVKDAIISAGKGEVTGSNSGSNSGGSGSSGSDGEEDSGSDDEEDSGGDSGEESGGTGAKSSRSSGRARNSSGPEATSDEEESEEEEESGEEKDEDSSDGSSVEGDRSSRSTFSGHQAYESEEEGDGEEKTEDGDDFSQSGVSSSHSTFSGHSRYRPQDDEEEDEKEEEDSDRDSDSPSEDDGSDVHSEDAVANGTSSDGFDEDDD